MIGIGAKDCKLSVYIGNRPPMPEYCEREVLIPAVEGEIARIAGETGNHWRKVFNVYAKLAFILEGNSFPTWQSYRDDFLLRKESKQALLFDKEIVTETPECINLLCGKTHAMTLVEECDVKWIDGDFAINRPRRLIVTPYFDYRQLSNVKLETLVGIIRGFDESQEVLS